MGEHFDRDGVQKRIATSVYRLVIDVGIKGRSGNDAGVVGAISVMAGPPTTSKNDWDNKIPPRISASFDAFWEGAPDAGRLKVLAKRLGGNHFNFYQVIEEDSPTSAAFSQTATPPYVDPPRGGFPSSPGENDAIWSDNIPWYHDEMLPRGDKDDPKDSFTAAGNVSPDGNSIKYYDDPHFDSDTPVGAKTQFKTWLVLVKGPGAGVRKAYRPVAFLGGFQWKVTKNSDGGRTTEILHRTDTNYPTESDYEQLLNQPVLKQPDGRNVPSWFDTNPANFAPYPNAKKSVKRSVSFSAPSNKRLDRSARAARKKR